jgi:hypothetical protein
VAINAGRHVSIVDQNPEAIDTAIVRAVHDSIAKFIDVEVEIL